MPEYPYRRSDPYLNNEARTPRRRQQIHPTRPAPYATHALRDTTTTATKAGGLTTDGDYDFGKLRHTVADVCEPPALILFCLTDRGALRNPLTCGFAQLPCSRRRRSPRRRRVNRSGLRFEVAVAARSGSGMA